MIKIATYDITDYVNKSGVTDTIEQVVSGQTYTDARGAENRNIIGCKFGYDITLSNVSEGLTGVLGALCGSSQHFNINGDEFEGRIISFSNTISLVCGSLIYYSIKLSIKDNSISYQEGDE